MQFIYSNLSGNSRIELDGELYNYIFKVRRHRADEVLFLRNLESPKTLFQYRISDVSRRKAILNLENQAENFVEQAKKTVLGWCLVDPKTVEKTLSMLNELGISKIAFIYCDFSQKNFKLDFDRIQRILETSSMQCGRFDIPKVETFQNLETFLETYKNAFAIDFSENRTIPKSENLEFVVGCEGGFSENERKLFKNSLSLPSANILRSETAVVSALSILNL
ncbi:RNA methyltransferase, RsmE family [Thiovulum sp. ES]|nr:RNA methyltransferase, RsmE family [Thiovulum sp. ES]